LAKAQDQRPVYRRLLLPIYFPSLLDSTSLQAVLVLLPLYALDSGASAASAAALVGIRGLGMLALDIPVGIFLSRYGDKPVLLFGLLGMAAGALLLAFSSSPWALGVAAFLSGSGFTAWMIGRQSYISDTSALSERGRAIAVMAGIMRMGALTGPAAGALVAQVLGYKVAFLALASLTLSAAVLVALKADDTRPAGHARPADLRGIWKVIADHRRTWLTGGIASLGLQLMRSGRLLLIPLFGHFLGLDVAAIGLIVSLAAALDTALFYPVGWLMDRIGRKWAGVPSLLAYAAGYSLLPLTQGYYSLLAVALILGFANGLSTGLLLTVGADLAPPAHRGEFLGIWRLIGDLGHAGGPMMIGALIDLATLLAASLATAGIGFACAGVMYWLMEETLAKDQVGRIP
jgi:MFS family permease